MVNCRTVAPKSYLGSSVLIHPLGGSRVPNNCHSSGSMNLETFRLMSMISQLCLIAIRTENDYIFQTKLKITNFLTKIT